VSPRTKRVTVSFGKSATGVRTVPVDGRSYSEWLRSEGWTRTRRYPHSRNGRVVAVKYRWEKPGEVRIFTSYRIIEGEPIPLLLADELAKVIARGQRVWLTESHSDVEALINIGGVFATTNWAAAGSWSKGEAEQLRGARQVVIVQHRDPAGRAFARLVADSLAGLVQTVRIVEPPSPYNDAREALEARCSVRDFRTVQRG
jgi:hypothetical protein